MRKVKIVSGTTRGGANILEKDGRNLFLTGNALPLGTEIEVGDPERLGFDHGNLMAFAFIMNNQTFYVLARDVGEYRNDPLALGGKSIVH